MNTHHSTEVAEVHPSKEFADVILRRVILGGLFLLPFICLIVSNHLFFPFISGKNFTFRIIVEIITCLWLVLALRDRSVLPKFSRIFQAFAIFTGLIFISDLFSPNVLKSFWSNYERMEGFVTLAHLFALFVVASSVMTRKLWERLFQVSVGVSLIIFFYGCFQLAGKLVINQGGVRLDATFGNATYLAIYMLFHVFLSLVLLSWSKRGSLWQWFYGFAIFADIFILYHTATRGATLGLLGGLFLSAALIAFFQKEKNLLRQIALGVVIAVPVLVGVFWLVKDVSFIKNSPVLGRFSSLSFTDKTAQSRFLIWGMALEGFKENPVLGWGQESFNYVFNKNYDPRMYSNEQWFDRTHNVVLDWLIAGGALGLIAYLSLFGFVVYYLWRKDSPFSLLERALFTGLLAGYFVHNLTVFDNITSYILFVFVIAFVDSSVGKASPALAEKIGQVDETTKNRILIPLFCIVAVFAIYKINVPSLLAGSELIRALSTQPGSPATNLQNFTKALAYNGFGNAEIREQLIQTTNRALEAQGVDPKVQSDFFNLARKETLLQLEQTPEDARYYLFAGAFLSAYGDFDNAITYLSKAHDLSPKKQTILFSLGSAYLGKKDYVKGAEVMKQAFDLDQSFDEARRIYAIALVYNKQGKLAAEVLAPLPAESVLSDQRLVLAYFTVGYYEEALESINFLLKNNPNNAQFYFTRAAIEVQLGRRTAAISDLNKVSQINPAAKAQVDALIAQVREGKSI